MPEGLPPPDPDEDEVEELIDELEVHSLSITPDLSAICSVTDCCSGLCTIAC